MNQNLINIADNLPNLRKILNLRQAELSDLMEISRPTLIKVEQNPTKFNYPLAINLLGSVVFILKSDYKTISIAKINHQKSLELFLSLLKNKKNLKSFSQSNVNCLLKELFPNDVKGTYIGEEEYYLGLMNEDFNKIHEKFIFILEEYLYKKNEDCLKLFGLNNWDIIEFVQKMK